MRRNIERKEQAAHLLLCGRGVDKAKNAALQPSSHLFDSIPLRDISSVVFRLHPRHPLHAYADLLLLFIILFVLAVLLSVATTGCISSSSG